MMPVGSEDQNAALVERRFDTVLAVARQNGTSVPIGHISDLMPPVGPQGPGAVLEWLSAHPTTGTLVGDRVVAGPVPPEGEGVERRARGERYLTEAEWVVRVPMTHVRGLLRCVAVTGSAAYGEPSRHDDLDFFVVTRRGAVWPVLLYLYLAARLSKAKRSPDDPSHWCFNYVVDERAAREEFATARGFLFAREALTARPVAGNEFYRGLIHEASWLPGEVPRLYRSWERGGLPPLPAEAPAPPIFRALNLLLYPLVAGYLTLAAMVRNRRYRRRGQSAKCFRVDASLHRLTFATERFEELRALYEPTSFRDSAESA
ncbi:MAG: hypothetical protein L3J96_00070 [Thermoplasmata archaeon]|nr:hypothetical protein [Thermoplasmata archaeon]